jgi:uncharacterized protein (TIGR02186 family)
MIRGARLVLAILALWLASPAPASAERLVVSLSTHRVLISSNFAGFNLTLFGAIEQDAASVGRAGGYAVAINVVGPRQATIAWRKERVLGIWVNASSRMFVDVPSYLAVLTNRPVDDVAPVETRQRLGLGLAKFALPQRIGADRRDPGPSDPYRQAFVQLKTEQQLYHEYGNAVTFVTPSLFRSGIPLPANVPVGTYLVEAQLFADGALIAREETAFEIVKAGFEQFVADAARDHSLLYGLATTLLALFTGWIGSIVFRRD